MWLFTRDAFVSVVRHETDHALLLVRARRKEDITALWPLAQVIATPGADYPFRASISEIEVVDAFSRAIRAIEYTTNFKGGAADSRRHETYARVWQATHGLETPRR